jgi:hypothetical protein
MPHPRACDAGHAWFPLVGTCILRNNQAFRTLQPPGPIWRSPLQASLILILIGASCGDHAMTERTGDKLLVP